MSEYHSPVLLDASVSALLCTDSRLVSAAASGECAATGCCGADGVYADATFGGGGHSREILSRLSSEGRLIAFDRDEDALRNGIDDPRFTLIHNNFRFIYNYALLFSRSGRPAAGASPDESGADDCKEGYFDGILADLGVSSHQFDTAERGFSFRFSAPLDMRMNAQGGKTASDIVNSYTQEELETVLKIYGEVENAHKVAQLIVSARAKAPILTTDDLDKSIAAALPSFAQHKELARIYQAFRMVVNQEMRSLEKFLEGSARALKPGGRLVIITYHSLEDRMVKNFIRSGNVAGVDSKDMFGRVTAPLKALNRKPILPEEPEIASNTRARSAKMRIALKVCHE